MLKKTYFTLQIISKIKTYLKKLKLILKNTIIDKTLTYASETSTLTKRDKKQFNILERNVYRINLGPVCGNEKAIWRTFSKNNFMQFLTLSLLMLYICGVSKTFGECYQKTNKTEDTNKLTLLASKIIIILHNTQLATFIKLLETVSKGLFRNRSQNPRTCDSCSAIYS
jgi:hypothetical protein